MAYGTPASAEDLAAYYTHIRRGRPPSDEQLAELRGRYDAIGGMSPLRRITEAQRDRIATALGDGFEVALGYKHASPFIEDAVVGLENDDVTEIVGVVLAPHDSRGSIGEYVERLGSDAKAVRSWHHLPAWRTFQANAIGPTLSVDAVADARRLHRALVARARARGRRVRRRTACLRRRHRNAEQDSKTTDGRSVGSRRGGRRNRGGAPTSARCLETLASDGGRRRRARVSARVHGGPSRSALRPRRRRPPASGEAVGLRFGRTAMVNDDAEVLAALAGEVRALAA